MSRCEILHGSVRRARSSRSIAQVGASTDPETWWLPADGPDERCQSGDGAGCLRRGRQADIFDQHAAQGNRFQRRLIYGGHVISLARALSFNGLANAFHVAAINGGRHVAPLFAGDTVYAWSEVLDKAAPAGRTDVGALRLRLVATKNQPGSGFPDRQGDGTDPAVILDLDYWALMPV